MNLILFCVFLTFSIGLFLLLAGLLRLPTLKTSRVMMDTGKEGKQLSKTLDAFYMDGAVKIAKYIRMNDYKKNRMANVLRASGLGMTPEVYTAYAYLKAGSVFLLIIPALHVFPLAALFVILLGIMIYYKEIQKADEMLKEKRDRGRVIPLCIYYHAGTEKQQGCAFHAGALQGKCRGSLQKRTGYCVCGYALQQL